MIWLDPTSLARLVLNRSFCQVSVEYRYPNRIIVLLGSRNLMSNELSVSFNQYLGKYLAVHSYKLSGKIVARTAASPWGPWSHPILLYTVKVTREKLLPYPQLIYAGKEHPELSEENGKIIYITYIEFEEYFPHLLGITLEKNY